MPLDTQKLVAQLKRDEGIRLESYKDSLGYWTIGVGHLLGAEQRMSRITFAEADALLQTDVAIASDTLVKIAPWYTSLDDVRQAALLNMTFNLGPKIGQFRHFLDALQAHDYDTAARQMLESLWAKQVSARAERLSAQIRTGVWQ